MKRKFARKGEGLGLRIKKENVKITFSTRKKQI